MLLSLAAPIMFAFTVAVFKAVAGAYTPVGGGTLLATPAGLQRAVEAVMLIAAGACSSMGFLVGKLLELASKYDIPAVVVSWSKSKAGKSFRERERKKMLKNGEHTDIELGLGATEFEFIGGRHLEYNSKVILRLIRLKEPFGRIALLEKHLEMPTPTLTLLKMEPGGFNGVDGEIHVLDDYWRMMKEEEAKPKPKRKKRAPPKAPKPVTITKMEKEEAAKP